MSWQWELFLNFCVITYLDRQESALRVILTKSGLVASAFPVCDVMTHWAFNYHKNANFLFGMLKYSILWAFMKKWKE